MSEHLPRRSLCRAIMFEFANKHQGDKVLVPDFSFFATAGVVSRLNAEPVFLEIDPTTFNLCPKHLEEKLDVLLQEMLPQEYVGNTVSIKYFIETIPVSSMSHGVPLLHRRTPPRLT